MEADELEAHGSADGTLQLPPTPLLDLPANRTVRLIILVDEGVSEDEGQE